MRNYSTIKLIGLFIVTSPLFAHAQSTKSYAVMLERIGTGLPIQLGWDFDADANSYQVYRRLPGAASWGVAIASKTSNDTTFLESNTLNGTYEYYVQKNLKNGKLGSGYLITSTQIRGYQSTARILVLIDANYVIPLQAQIAQLVGDLVADGWFVDTLVIQRSLPVKSVKQQIMNWYNLYQNGPAKPEALYLLGRIPVPYSGEIFPDGHRPDHRGAWPADVYYGVMNEGIWTDANINTDSASQSRNHNLIGDNKFDVSLIYPDTTSLQIGRVDLTDMPLFGLSDTVLVQNYLSRAHQFKTLGFVPARKALVDDNFGAMGGEAFAASGWRSFGSALGKNNVVAVDYLTGVKGQSYLMSYGCGGGTYTSATGIANSTDFKSDSINTVFTALFGSYFGDWDNSNNFLRAPLCSKPMTLASIWSGRPHWNLHPMGVGYTIGHCARIAQNNIDGRLLQPQTVSGYVSSSFPTYIHISLMGDPSLRLFYNVIPTQLQANANVDSTQYALSWQAVLNATGYEVYLSQNPMQIGKLVATVNTPSYNLTKLSPGENIVHVRAIHTESSPSGLFEQRSLGLSTKFVGGVNATGLNLINGDLLELAVYPNPSLNWFAVAGKFKNIDVQAFTLAGQMVYEQLGISSGEPIKHQLSTGIYLLKLTDGTNTTYRKLVVE